MKKTKPILTGMSLLFSFMLVYGSAIFVRLFTGHFLFENGLFDIGYAFITFAIAAPLITYVSFMNKSLSAIILSGFMTSCLYFAVYATSVSSDVALNLSETFQFSLLFLVLTTVLINAVHFGIYNHLPNRYFVRYLLVTIFMTMPMTVASIFGRIIKAFRKTPPANNFS